MPDLKQFKKHKDYLKWYTAYREKNREKIRKYNREYMRIRRQNLSTGRVVDK